MSDFLYDDGRERESGALTVFAATSLTKVIQEVGTEFRLKTGCDVRLNFASSPVLAQQIEDGAFVDVFLSASKKWVDYLDDRSLVKEGTGSVILANRLALIAPLSSRTANISFSVDSAVFSGFNGKFAMADPDRVPAGVYAKAALEYFGWYGKLQKNMLLCANVHEVLALVESAKAALGVVYATGAIASQKVKVVSIFPSCSHPPVVYYGAVPRVAGEGAWEFMKFLAGPQASAIFSHFGFLPKTAKA